MRYKVELPDGFAKELIFCQKKPEWALFWREKAKVLTQEST